MDGVKRSYGNHCRNTSFNGAEKPPVGVNGHNSLNVLDSLYGRTARTEFKISARTRYILTPSGQRLRA
jgi:hypothetical protein